MAYADSDLYTRPGPARRPPQSTKTIVAGGVGKTTFVGAVSEIMPLTTEAVMTPAASTVDDVTHVAAKTTTTVAMDSGRITVDESLVLYLFGTPGQDRFGFMWDDIVLGALVAVVLVDTRRLGECYPAVDYFEIKGIPFIVAVNDFDGAERHPIDDVREALDVPPQVPIIGMDPAAATRRERRSSRRWSTLSAGSG